MINLRSGGWIGVDLDGTLAYDVQHSPAYPDIGAPVPMMLARVKDWLDQGFEVRLFTARCFEETGEPLEEVIALVQKWLLRHLGQTLPITNVKDFKCVQIWDDRAIQVIKDTGMPITGASTYDRQPV